MSRKDYIEHVVADLAGERSTDVVKAIVKNFCVDEDLAKLALRRAARAWREKKTREKR